MNLWKNAETPRSPWQKVEHRMCKKKKKKKKKEPSNPFSLQQNPSHLKDFLSTVCFAKFTGLRMRVLSAASEPTRRSKQHENTREYDHEE